MKLDFFESDMGVEIRLIPETMKEVNELARYARNAKAVKPSVYLEFYGDQPKLNIWLEKIAKVKQSTSIKPGLTEKPTK